MQRIFFIILAIAIVGGGYYWWRSDQKDNIVPDNAVNIEYPLKDGDYKVIQNGKFGAVHTSESEKYAMDIVKFSSLKSWFQFRKSGLESDDTFGTPIYSPCYGNIKKVNQNFSDMPIGIVGKPSEANTVLVGCYGFNISLVHFKQNSVVVKEGDLVGVGQMIGEAGNSGKSTRPHLHIAAYTTDPQTNISTNVPITFQDKYFVRGDNFSN